MEYGSQIETLRSGIHIPQGSTVFSFPIFNWLYVKNLTNFFQKAPLFETKYEIFSRRAMKMELKTVEPWIILDSRQKAKGFLSGDQRSHQLKTQQSWVFHLMDLAGPRILGLAKLDPKFLGLDGSIEGKSRQKGSSILSIWIQV